MTRTTDTTVLADLDRIDEGIRFHVAHNDMNHWRADGFAHEIKRATGWHLDTCRRYVSQIVAGEDLREFPEFS